MAAMFVIKYLCQIMNITTYRTSNITQVLQTLELPYKVYLRRQYTPVRRVGVVRTNINGENFCPVRCPYSVAVLTFKAY